MSTVAALPKVIEPDPSHVIAFWTLGGDDPIIYGTISGQDFLT